MDNTEVELAIHNHPITPLKDDRRGDCCGIKFEAISDGYYCAKCDYFFHEICSNPPGKITHPYHKCYNTTLTFQNYRVRELRCAFCGESILDGIKFYSCAYCSIKIHLGCAKYPPPKIIEVPQNHDHKLELKMVQSCFTCAACGKDGDGYPYKCHECDLEFHVNCKKYAAEVNHPSHSLHPLKVIYGEPPTYTSENCRLCAKPFVDGVFYHCSKCNLSLDLHCVYNPPPQYSHNLNTHDHTLTLMPKMISFTCTTCGLKGDRSPYVCLQCDFMAHNECLGFPWVININRHNHRVSRSSLIGVVNAICGVCQKKMDWSCGGYSCQRCPNSTFHTKCATREDVCDGIEMKDEPEEDEDIESFEVIDENTIQHFKHKWHNLDKGHNLDKEHYLRLDKSGIYTERCCMACAYPIYYQTFYSCMSCKFVLHASCAILPRRKRHMVSNKPYTLHTDHEEEKFSVCKACRVLYNGFKYSSQKHGLDVRCASVTEPFVHQSHPHPLFYTLPRGVCSACNKEAHHVLRCVEDDCEYVLDFKCALLPYVVKHRVDDHFVTLCYGENASGKYWCDICEKETDPKAWFYTCKDCGLTLHTNCVLGDFRGLKPGSRLSTFVGYPESYKVARNNTMSRPLCDECKSRCIFPIILEIRDDLFICSIKCCPLKYFKA